MASKVRSRGYIVLDDRGSGLNLDCDSVNYPGVFSVLESCEKGTGKGLCHVRNLLTNTCKI